MALRTRQSGCVDMLSSVRLVYIGITDQVDQIQVIDLKRRYPLDIATSTLPGSSGKDSYPSLQRVYNGIAALVIAVATTSRVIDIYVRADGQDVRPAWLFWQLALQ